MSELTPLVLQALALQEAERAEGFGALNAALGELRGLEATRVLALARSLQLGGVARVFLRRRRLRISRAGPEATVVGSL